MSETISGVTLLAFANGAPDILASLSAGGEEEGIYIAVGNLLGGCLFASTVVVSRCVFVCPKPVTMKAGPWNRDLCFYIGTVLVILFYGLVGKLHLWMSLSFFGIYGLYFSVVLYVYIWLTSNTSPAIKTRSPPTPRRTRDNWSRT